MEKTAVMKFAEQVKVFVEEMIERDGRDIQLEVKQISKNGVLKTGIAFNGESNVSPIIYVDDMAEEFFTPEKGRSLRGTAEEVYSTYDKAMLTKPFGSTLLSDLFDIEKSKDKLLVTVVNAAINEIDDYPHVRINDLAFIVRFVVSFDANGASTAKVNNAILEQIGISKEELFELAWESTRKNFKPVVKDMFAMVMGMLGADIEDMSDYEGRMFVVKNTIGTLGASYGFDIETLKHFCNAYNEEEVYILPASIHETILVPASKVDDSEDFSEMVTSVNDKAVDPTDWLSNNAYKFVLATEELTVI